MSISEGAVHNTDPSKAELTVRFTVDASDSPESAIRLSSFPESQRSAWNITDLFQQHGVPLMVGTYVFEQNAGGDFRVLQVPEALGEDHRRKLSVAFAAALDVQFAKLVSALRGLPREREIEQIAREIARAIFRPSLHNLGVVPPFLPDTITVQGISPYQNAAEALFERSDDLLGVVAGIAGAAQAFLRPSVSRIDYAIHRQPESKWVVHVGQRLAEPAFSPHVNAIIGDKCRTAIHSQVRALAYAEWQRMNRGTDRASKGASEFAHKWGFDGSAS